MNTEAPEPVQTNEPVAGSIATRADITQLTPSSIRLRSILVPIDFSETSLKALQYAVPFAKQFDAKLTLVHIVDLPVYAESPFSAPLGPEELGSIKKKLQEICVTKIPPELSTEVTVRRGAVFEGILEVARESSTDLIITTTHGLTGLKHIIMGSTAEDIVRRAPCPVLVVRKCEHEFA